MKARLAIFARLTAAVTLFIAPCSGALAAALGGPAEETPLVIAHRGASGARPEHTLAAYELALAEGADYIELDLVPTGDGALIARHENALAMVAVTGAGVIERDAAGRPRLIEQTTNVAEQEQFSDRLTVKRVDGRLVGGWFSEDFTLAEIGTLRARERLPELRPQNALHDDRYGIPTLADAMALLRAHQSAGGRPAGLYLELKHPTYFRYEGRRLDGRPISLDTAELLLRELRASAFPPGRVFVQCFEIAPLIELKDRLTAEGLPVRLIQLFGDLSNARYRAVPQDVRFHLTPAAERAPAASAAVYGDLRRLVRGGLHSDVSYAELAAPAVLEFMAERYADGVGPNWLNLLADVERDGSGLSFSGTLGPFLGRARAAGLLVHPYTLRAERPFLVSTAGRLLTVDQVAGLLLAHGASGFFIDQPSEGRLAVDGWRRRGDAPRELESGSGL